MTEARETPSSEDQLYEHRGSVPLARPNAQGDVFRDVEIPGFEGEQPPAVMVIQHPCSMRAGAALRPRLTVVAVRKNAKFPADAWQGYSSAMPLPGLLEDGKNYLADFRDSGPVRSSSLARATRVAAMTNYVANILQQRLAFYHTRFTIDIPTLAETFEPISTELELQYEWVEAALDALSSSATEQDVLSTVEAAELDFAAYLDENDQARRKALQQAAKRADVRRQVRREVAKRY